MPWPELERQLSWNRPRPGHPESHHRQPYEPPPAVVRKRGAVPYAELHCHTNFSFLDGASKPEELVEEAARLGLEALAVTDHDGMYGVVRFAEAAAAPDNVVVELWDHGDPLDSVRNDALVALAARGGVDVVATNNVHYATPARRPLATALAAVRARRSLDQLDGWLPAGATAHLCSGAEQARRFARFPGVVERAAELGRACPFDLSLVAPNLPDHPVPPGHTEMTWLRHLAYEGADRRYGPRHAERVAGAWAQID